MSQPQRIPPDARYNDKEYHPHSTLEVANTTHSTLEVANEPRNVVNDSEYQQATGSFPSHHQGDERSHSPYPQRGHSPREDQVERAGRKQNRRNTVIIITSAIVSALVAGGTVGAGLGSSLANCRTYLKYDYLLESNKHISILTSNISHDQPLPTIDTVFVSNKCASTSTGGMETSTAPLVDATAEATTTTGGLFINYRPEPTSAVGDLAMDCGALELNEQVTRENENFNVYCNVDLTHGSKQDASGAEVFVEDLIGITAYTFGDCLEACSLYTGQSGALGRDDGCGSVTFCTAMQKYSRDVGANCWLKNSTISISRDTNSTDCHSGVRVFS